MSEQRRRQGRGLGEAAGGRVISELLLRCIEVEGSPAACRRVMGRRRRRRRRVEAMMLRKEAEVESERWLFTCT